MQLRNLTLTICLAIVSASQAAAQPSIRAVVNAASQTPPSAPGDALAQGSQIRILGANLGPEEAVSVSAHPYPTADGLAGVTAKATVGGTTADLILVSASAGSVLAVLPSTLPVGTGTVTLTYKDASATSPVKVVAANVGIFTVGGTASGLATAVVVNADGSTTPVTADAPARPGQTVSISATGLGAVQSDEAVAPDSSDLSTEVVAWMGGKSATVTAKKRAGTAPGVDQIVITVPDGLNSCSVPLVLQSGGFVSNFAALPVAPDGPCPDQLLRPSDIEAIQQRGEYRNGGIVLGRTTIGTTIAAETFDITTESAGASFSAVKILSLAPGQYQVSGTATVGSCIVTVFGEAAAPVGSFEFRMLDAGPALALSGPKGDQSMAKKDGVYSATLGTPGFPFPGAPPPVTYLDPGDYTVTGPGGADVGPFTAKINIGPTLTWTNRATVGNAGNNTIDRTNDVTITWTGGRPDDIVNISGISSITATRVTATFQCMEVASAGKFTVPAWVLSALPPTPEGILSVGIFANVPFKADGIDSGSFSFNSTSSRTIAYR
ncbi:MAG: hypothetical protein HY820_14470 [Acidobacteria bacterium]|nr:hypothetical protein [Acidobacteriota bacterium]